MDSPDIDDETVAAVARLARLGLPPAELAAAAGELAGLLGHFKALQDVDTSEVGALMQARPGAGAPAPDLVRDDAAERAALLALTEHLRENFYVVPRVLDADFGAPDA